VEVFSLPQVSQEQVGNERRVCRSELQVHVQRVFGGNKQVEARLDDLVRPVELDLDFERAGVACSCMRSLPRQLQILFSAQFFRGIDVRRQFAFFRYVEQAVDFVRRSFPEVHRIGDWSQAAALLIA
jgi:hypothetical protein